MASNLKSCPFKKGDMVIYSPSDRGRGLAQHTWAGELQHGRQYRVAKVQKEQYLVIEGFEGRAGGGLHWSQFNATS